MMNILVFDIETIPDVDSGRKLHDLANLSDADVASAMFALRRQKNGTDFLPHHLQRVVAISVLVQRGDSIKLWSLGEETDSEPDIIKRFFSGIDKYTPSLVSWNGSGFDLPVLHYRALLWGIPAPTYWEVGENQSPFRWNNYLNRFHYRHLDLMDVLAGYQLKAAAPLDEIATLNGLPGKMGMHGSHVWPQFQAGNIRGIRDYCETDVLNTYGLYLRFELLRGTMTEETYHDSWQRLRDYLAAQDDRPHLQAFLSEMKG